MVLSVARTATARAAVAPTVSLSHTRTGSVQEEFRINIRFSQNVTGFTHDDIQVDSAEIVLPPGRHRPELSPHAEDEAGL